MLGAYVIPGPSDTDRLFNVFPFEGSKRPPIQTWHTILQGSNLEPWQLSWKPCFWSTIPIPNRQTLRLRICHQQSPPGIRQVTTARESGENPRRPTFHLCPTPFITSTLPPSGQARKMIPAYMAAAKDRHLMWRVIGQRTST